jgi:5-formyltetrahydrofolate cyclo-ligase
MARPTFQGSPENPVMSAEIQSTKAALRTKFRAALQGMSSTSRVEGSHRICETLLNQPVWQAAKSVVLYAPLPLEPDVLPLAEVAVEQGKVIAYPRYNAETLVYDLAQVVDREKDLQKGKFGVLEPGLSCATLPLNQLDLVLVPGVGFGLDGSRLGRGKGFFDRLLALTSGVTCGVGFDEQVTATLPVEAHDIRLSYLLTPTRWLTF